MVSCQEQLSLDWWHELIKEAWGLFEDEDERESFAPWLLGGFRDEPDDYHVFADLFVLALERVLPFEVFTFHDVEVPHVHCWNAYIYLVVVDRATRVCLTCKTADLGGETIVYWIDIDNFETLDELNGLLREVRDHVVEQYNRRVLPVKSQGGVVV